MGGGRWAGLSAVADTTFKAGGGAFELTLEAGEGIGPSGSGRKDPKVIGWLVPGLLSQEARVARIEWDNKDENAEEIQDDQTVVLCRSPMQRLPSSEVRGDS